MEYQVGSGARPLLLAARLALLGLLVVSGVAIVGGYLFEYPAETWVESIESEILAWGPWGIVVSMGLMVLHSLIPFPAEFLAVANGMLYGPVLGSAVTWSGAMLGTLLAFGLARLLGCSFVELLLARSQSSHLVTWSEEKAGHWIFLARFVPVIAFNHVNYAAGLTRVTWWTFIWTTGLGILAMTALMVTIEASIRHLDWQWWLVLLAGGFSAWLVLRRWLEGQS